MRKIDVKKTAIGCSLAFLVITGTAPAQNAPALTALEARAELHVSGAPPVPTDPTLEPPAPTRLEVTLAHGRLTIDAADSTLGNILTKVAALTGMKIDMPEGARSERMNVVKLGPGPARQVVASLLYGTNFDYVILASATDPNGIQNVLLTPRGKIDRGDHSADRVTAKSYSSPYAGPTRTTSEYSQASAPAESAPAQQDNSATSANSSPPASGVSGQPLLTKAAAQMNRSGLTTEGAVSLPASLDTQSIEQKLQQMYQQRTQMMRVINPQATNSAVTSPGTK